MRHSVVPLPKACRHLLALGALIVFPASADVIVSEDSDWRYLKGLTEASSPDLAAWRLADFNDASWSTGQGPFYYEDASGFSGNTALTDMRGAYTCVFLRRSFNVTNPAGLQELILSLQADDGCVAWLNGIEVARVNMPDGDPLVSWTSLPAAGEPNLLTLTLTNAATLLRSGANILAVQAFNSSVADSTDFLIAASLSGNLDVQPPVVADLSPAAGAQVRSLTTIEVVFSESVTGVDAADLRINDVPATSLAVYSPRDYGFSFTQPAAGNITISWTPNPGITDLAEPPNPFAGGSWSYVLDPNAPAADLLITEFLADNENGLRDDFAERSDWIEIWNRGDEPADLTGWFLTDDADDLAKWRFPAVTIPADGYLVVRASDRDLANPGAPLHTNFKLGPGGEYLALVDPATNVVSEFTPTYPPQQPDISYGRDQTSPTLVGYFATPTPGAPNNTQGAGIAPAPVFSLPGGVFTNASVTIALSTLSGTIRYTTDGTRPTTSSPIYSSPISLARSGVIHARVFQDGLLPGPIVAQTYALLGTSAATFTSNLPLLIVDTSGRGIAAESRTLATVTTIEPFRGRAGLSSPPNLQTDCQIELRGQSSLGFPKVGYNLELNSAQGNDLEAPLLGLPAESDWVLYAPYSDKPFLQNFLAYELHEKMGHYSPRRRFVEVFVDTSGGRLEYPGDYVGIYILVEKIKVDDNRVDLARLSPLHNAEPEVSGGYIIKKDKDSPGDLNFSTAGGSGFSPQYLKIHEPKPREITPAQFTWIQNYLRQFERALYSASWLTSTGTNHYAHYIDVDSFVDSHWIVEFPKQIDGYRLSNYMNKDRNGKLRMDPIWDWNLSFGNADYLDGANTSGWYYTLLGDPEHIWLRRLICGTTSSSGTSGDPDFNQKIADRWSVLRTNILSSTNLLLRIDELAASLNEAQARDFSRWPRLGTYIWPNPPLYSTPTTYAGIIANLKNWVRSRYNWIDTQFVLAPSLSVPAGGVSPGFTLSLAAPAGTIYFTTDGSDPRAPGGGIATSASPYLGPFTIQTNRRVVARARNGTRWSGPAAATYVVETPPLVVTELMYSPASTAGALTNDAAQFEFVELLNAGSQPLDLRGFAFTDGIQYSFSTSSITTLAPGDRVVVARNPAALTARHGAIPRLAGPFLGSLANEGERITLIGPMHETVASLRFDPEAFPATDGLDFALVATTEGQPPGVTSPTDGWRTGTTPGGTPGNPEPPAPAFPRVVIHEVLSHTDPPLTGSIELWNAGPDEADLGGWFLSDDRLTPKFRIPDGTTLAPGACRLFTEADFNSTPGIPPAFTLRASGDEAFLYSANASGQLTGYVHGYDFGASLNGVSFGQYTTSVGETHFVAQAARSLGQTNGSPRVGPIVISEIHYHPPDVFTNAAYWDNTEHEFIELVNLGPTTVELFDPTAPTNTWRLRDAVSFAFPTNQTLNPGSRLLVVSFDPVADPTSATAFRTRFGLGAGVRLFGPFQGKLSNGGDSLELIQPDLVRFYATNEVVTSVLVDRVNYRDALPWPPGADGLGFSLQRRVESAYGDDPANWVAATPSPASGLAAATEPTILTQPASQSVLPGTSVTFTVAAEGAAPLQYQWRFNGENLLGATAASLTLPNAQPPQSGEYQVVVATAARAVASAPALLRVGTPPAILQSPVSQSVSPGVSVTLSVVAQGNAPLRYQWRRNGTNITNATRASLAWTDVDAAAEGTYDVQIWDDVGIPASSATANVSVVGDPVILQHPTSTSLSQGDTATLLVTVTNTTALPITCEWFKDATLIATHSVLAYSDTLLIPNAQPADAGAYAVRILNRAIAPPGVTSQTATLVVQSVQDTDDDGMPDDFENDHGLDYRNPADAGLDPDHDGASNLEEYRAGTDPQDPDSVLRVDPPTAAGPVTVRFRGLDNRSYSLLHRDAIPGQPWTALTNVPALPAGTGTTRLVEVVDPTASGVPQRYYRLQTPALPTP